MTCRVTLCPFVSSDDDDGDDGEPSLRAASFRNDGRLFILLSVMSHASHGGDAAAAVCIMIMYDQEG
jgi:hypothetical protein